MEWFIPSNKGPLRALCLVLLYMTICLIVLTPVIILCLLVLTPVIVLLPVIAIFWMCGVCFSQDGCEPNDDAWEDVWEHGGCCCILAPCNKGCLCTVTVLLAWSLICPCPPGLATVVCFGLYCCYNCFCHKGC